MSRLIDHKENQDMSDEASSEPKQWAEARGWIEAFVAMAETYGHDAEARRADEWLAVNLDPEPVCTGCGDQVDAFCGWCS